MSDKRKYLSLGLLFSLPVTEDSHSSTYDVQYSLNLVVIWTRAPDKEQCFWGVSSPLFVEKINGEVNISHETTTIVVWIYDGV